MHRTWTAVDYFTKTTRDDPRGASAIELMRRTGDVVERVARVLFWDAAGDYALEMLTRELPLEIVEELIAEATATFGTRRSRQSGQMQWP